MSLDFSKADFDQMSGEKKKRKNYFFSLEKMTQAAQEICRLIHWYFQEVPGKIFISDSIGISHPAFLQGFGLVNTKSLSVLRLYEILQF